MNEADVLPELPSACAGAVPSGFADAAAHGVIREAELALGDGGNSGESFHGYEAVFRIPSVGEAPVVCQIPIVVIIVALRGGGEELPAGAGGGAGAISGGDAVGDVDCSATCGKIFVKVFVEPGAWQAVDGDGCDGGGLADDIKGAGNRAAYVVGVSPLD